MIAKNHMFPFSPPAIMTYIKLVHLKETQQVERIEIGRMKTPGEPEKDQEKAEM